MPPANLPPADLPPADLPPADLPPADLPPADLPPAETISITLTPDQSRALSESVAAGEFASASEALQDAVRVWQRQRAADRGHLDALRTRIRDSLADPREDLDMEVVRARIRALGDEAAAGRGG